jgi:hypothetical protein
MTTKRLQIFRAGRHTDMAGQAHDFTDADLAEIAASYSRQTYAAPLVIGHPQLDAPAYGWVDQLVCEGAVLEAVPADVEPQFAASVNAKRYPRISVALWPRSHPNNPTPGKLSLRHVGFLGATPPAVHGLAPAQFSDGGVGYMEFSATSSALAYISDTFRRLRDWLIGKEGLEAADANLPTWQIDAIAELARQADPPAAEPQNPAFAAAAADLATREQALAAREQAVAALEAEARRKAAAEALQTRRDNAARFAAALVDRNLILPRHRDGIAQLLLAAPADFQFAAGDQQQDAAQLIEDVLSSSRPPMGEAAPPAAAPRPLEFAVPAGAAVSADRMDLYARAKAWQSQHPGTDIVDAVRAIQGTAP